MQRIGSDELTEQLAYDRIEPSPDPYWIGALIAQTTAICNWSGKGRRPRFEDFLPKLQATLASSGTVEQNLANIQAYAALWNAHLEARN